MNLLSSTSSMSLEIALEVPAWWQRMPQKRKDNYLQMHPRSRYHRISKAELQEHLKKNPKERVKLRSALKKIAALPSTVKNQIKSVMKVDPKKFSKKDVETIKSSVKEAGKKGSSAKILKAVVTALAVAGALTIGGAVLATGGLPYVIIASRMIQDTVAVTRDIYSRVKQGQGVVESVAGATGKALAKAARDPKMLAAALMLANNKKDKDAEDEKPDAKEKPKAKKDVKVQSAPKKETKKETKKGGEA